MICKTCGNELPEGLKFCVYCGTPIQAPVPPAAPAAPAAPVIQNSLDPMPEPVYEPTPAPVQEPVYQPAPAPIPEPAYQPAPAPIPEPVAEPAPMPVQEPVYQPTPAPVQTPVYQPAPAPAQENVYQPAAAPVYAPTPAPAEKPKKKKKTGLILAIVIPVLLIVIGVAAWLVVSSIQNGDAYEQAEAYLAEGKYEDALKAFQDLGSYQDAAQRAEELEQWQEDYDTAVQLLADRKFDEAEDAFAKLAKDNYRDSADMAASGVKYEKAVYLLTSAQEGNTDALYPLLAAGEAVALGEEQLVMYKRAEAIFKELGEYKESKAKLQECYVGMAQFELDRGEHEQALEYMDMMDEATRESFEEVFQAACADKAAVEALIASLEEREILELDDRVSESDILEMELDMLEDFEYEYFLDTRLQELLVDYIHYLENQYLDIQSNDYYLWLEDVALGYETLETLQEEYGVLDSNADLYARYADSSDYWWALVELEPLVESQLIGVSAEYETNVGYYLVFNNSSEYSFTLDIYLAFYNGDLLMEENIMEGVEIAADGETVIYLDFPADTVNWDTWTVDWDTYGISLNGEAL